MKRMSTKKPRRSRKARAGAACPPSNEVVQLVPVASLHPHPRNAQVYREEPSQELISSVKEHGIRQPIVVNRKTGTIISGHLRYRAALAAGIVTAPVLYREYQNEIDELEALVEHNLQREKSEAERGEEMLLLYEIETARAKQRMIEGGRVGAAKGRSKSSYPCLTTEAPSGADTGKALGLAAKRVGWSYAKARQFLGIKVESPELLDELRRGGLTVNAAFRKVRELAAPKQPAGAATETKTQTNDGEERQEARHERPLAAEPAQPGVTTAGEVGSVIPFGTAVPVAASSSLLVRVGALCVAADAVAAMVEHRVGTFEELDLNTIRAQLETLRATADRCVRALAARLKTCGAVAHNDDADTDVAVEVSQCVVRGASRADSAPAVISVSPTQSAPRLVQAYLFGEPGREASLACSRLSATEMAGTNTNALAPTASAQLTAEAASLPARRHGSSLSDEQRACFEAMKPPRPEVQVKDCWRNRRAEWSKGRAIEPGAGVLERLNRLRRLVLQLAPRVSAATDVLDALANLIQVLAGVRSAKLLFDRDGDVQAKVNEPVSKLARDFRARSRFLRFLPSLNWSGDMHDAAQVACRYIVGAGAIGDVEQYVLRADAFARRRLRRLEERGGNAGASNGVQAVAGTYAAAEIPLNNEPEHSVPAVPTTVAPSDPDNENHPQQRGSTARPCFNSPPSLGKGVRAFGAGPHRAAVKTLVNRPPPAGTSKRIGVKHKQPEAAASVDPEPKSSTFEQMIRPARILRAQWNKPDAPWRKCASKLQPMAATVQRMVDLRRLVAKMEPSAPTNAALLGVANLVGILAGDIDPWMLMDPRKLNATDVGDVCALAEDFEPRSKFVEFVACRSKDAPFDQALCGARWAVLFLEGHYLLCDVEERIAKAAVPVE